jgi:hypothetical protein
MRQPCPGKEEGRKRRSGRRRDGERREGDEKRGRRRREDGYMEAYNSNAIFNSANRPEVNGPSKLTEREGERDTSKMPNFFFLFSLLFLSPPHPFLLPSLPPSLPPSFP